MGFRPFAANARNLATLVVVTLALAIGYVVYPNPGIQYAAWLVVFSVWMLWFVLNARDWLEQAHF